MAPSNVEIDDLVQKAADVLHADGQHALFCFSPQRYKSQPVSSVLSAQRRIEDKMLKCKLNFETAISIHYHVESMHANDRRHLSAMTRFAVSDELPADQWLQSQAARGKIENVPLVRVREMKKPKMPGAICSVAPAQELSPQERLFHRGSAAASRILDSIVEGTAMNSADCLLQVVEMRMQNNPDWVEGVWSLMKVWEQRADKPRLAYLGLCAEKEACTCVKTHMESVLLEQWWPTHPAAGPAEPSNPDPIELPNLRLASFNDAREPLLPEVVVSKFDTDEVLRPKWSKCTADFRQLVQNEILPKTRRNPTTAEAGGNSSTSGQSGPDFSVDPCPVPPPRVIMPNIPASEFQEDQMFLSLLFTLVL